MWDIDDSHVLHLADWEDVTEYLRALLAHIENIEVLDIQDSPMPLEHR